MQQQLQAASRSRRRSAALTLSALPVLLQVLVHQLLLQKILWTLLGLLRQSPNKRLRPTLILAPSVVAAVG